MGSPCQPEVESFQFPRPTFQSLAEFRVLPKLPPILPGLEPELRVAVVRHQRGAAHNLSIDLALLFEEMGLAVFATKSLESLRLQEPMRVIVQPDEWKYS